jgi:hypothetical protein
MTTVVTLIDFHAPHEVHEVFDLLKKKLRRDAVQWYYDATYLSGGTVSLDKKSFKIDEGVAHIFRSLYIKANRPYSPAELCFSIKIDRDTQYQQKWFCLGVTFVEDTASSLPGTNNQYYLLTQHGYGIHSDSSRHNHTRLLDGFEFGNVGDVITVKYLPETRELEYNINNGKKIYQLQMVPPGGMPIILTYIEDSMVLL